MVEFLGGGGAYVGVQTGHDVEQLLLAGVVGQGLVAQIAGDQLEIRGGGADGGQIAGELDGGSFEGGLGHGDSPIWVCRVVGTYSSRIGFS